MNSQFGENDDLFQVWGSPESISHVRDDFFGGRSSPKVCGADGHRGTNPTMGDTAINCRDFFTRCPGFNVACEKHLLLLFGTSQVCAASPVECHLQKIQANMGVFLK